MPVAITLPARLSRILAGTLKYTPDARDIDAARREACKLAREHAAKVQTSDWRASVNEVEIYSCKRYGGSLLDVVSIPLAPGLGLDCED